MFSLLSTVTLRDFGHCDRNFSYSLMIQQVQTKETIAVAGLGKSDLKICIEFYDFICPFSLKFWFRLRRYIKRSRQCLTTLILNSWKFVKNSTRVYSSLIYYSCTLIEVDILYVRLHLLIAVLLCPFRLLDD